MITIWGYLKERFPLPLVAVLAITYSLMIVGSATRLGGITSNVTKSVLLVGCAFIGLLLRQRVADEFKDLDHDTAHYPNRPLQRGSITTNKLIAIGIFATVLELISILVISISSIAYYIPVIVYSILMNFEFFSSKWLEKHFTVYFLSHEVIFLLLATWAYLTFNVPISPRIITGILIIISSMVCMEILRKFEIRRNHKGKVVNDTYPSVWGKNNSKNIIIILGATVGICISLLTTSLLPVVVSLFTTVSITIFFENMKIIKIIAGLSMLIQGLLLIFV